MPCEKQLTHAQERAAYKKCIKAALRKKYVFHESDYREMKPLS